MLITVFTPTYNRAKTITRTFESLKKQAFKDFEWLIVDDGSIDHTEQVVKAFREEATFEIVYIKKPNGGKHTAHNEAIKAAKGQLFFTVDSDDWLTENSLQDIADMSSRLLSDKTLAGIVALKELPDGTLLNKKFPEELEISSLRNLEQTGNGGERSLVFKTDILCHYPYPVIKGEKFIGECVVYDQLDKRYKFIVSNSVLTTCEYQVEGLTRNIRKIMISNPVGYMIYHSQRIDSSISVKERINHILRYTAFKKMSGRKGQNYLYKGKYQIACKLLDPLGLLVVSRYKYKLL